MEKCCKKCDKIFYNGEKFCSHCGQKLVKLDVKGDKGKIKDYYKKMFAGTNTDIVTLENNHLLVRFRDSNEVYNKVFARICDAEKCDLLKYSISIDSANGPILVLRMAPKEYYLYEQIYDVRVYGSVTPKNMERLKKYQDENGIQLEANYIKGKLDWIEKTVSLYKEEQKKWAKSLKLLEKTKGGE